MKVELSNDEVTTIVTALVKMPWIEVNDVINKLTEPKTEPIPVAVHHSMIGQDHAPYGLKKDGTPAKRRGRKPSAKRKTRQ